MNETILRCARCTHVYAFRDEHRRCPRCRHEVATAVKFQSDEEAAILASEKRGTGLHCGESGPPTPPSPAPPGHRVLPDSESDAKLRIRYKSACFYYGCPPAGQGVMKPPAKTPAAPLRIVYKQRAPQPALLPDAGLAAHGGVLTETLRTTPPAACVAPVCVDGGTRFALDVDPGAFQPTPREGMVSPPAAALAVFDWLRTSTTREADARARQEGGCVVELPLPDGGKVHVRAEVRGTRREQLTLYMEDVAFVRIGLESGQVRLELKARALWAEGYRVVAGRLLDRILWWTTGHRCTLANAAAPLGPEMNDAPAWEWGTAPLGWRCTGIEVCSDFTGVEFAEQDMAAFVGFRAAEIVRTFVREGELSTLNLGTRASPISLCIYDKTEQVDVVKGGDDSCYRAAWQAHGWDGRAPIRRVEFRVTGRALRLVNGATGEVLNFQDPATLADPHKRALLWSILCSTKRLVVRENATRAERCKMDLRWDAVLAASWLPFQDEYRQHRAAHADTWRESEARARRDVLRALGRFAALHDQPDLSPTLAMRFLVSTSDEPTLAAARVHAINYRRTHEESIGLEIANIGGARWNIWNGGKAEREPGEDDPHHVGHRRRMPHALQGGSS